LGTSRKRLKNTPRAKENNTPDQNREGLLRGAGDPKRGVQKDVWKVGDSKNAKARGEKWDKNREMGKTNTILERKGSFQADER